VTVSFAVVLLSAIGRRGRRAGREGKRLAANVSDAARDYALKGRSGVAFVVCFAIRDAARSVGSGGRFADGYTRRHTGSLRGLSW